MAKYNKLSEEVEAVEFLNNVEKIHELVQFMDGLVRISYKEDNSVRLKIDTSKEEIEAYEGDYIIKGDNGEFYSVKPKIFKKNYKSSEQ